MLGKSVPLKTRIAVDVMAALIAISLIVAGWAFVDRFAQTDKRRAVQQNVNGRLHQHDQALARQNARQARAILDNCYEIEALKAALLEGYETSYANLQRDARALRIKLTPEALRIAAANIEQRRRDFGPDKCPRPTRG